MFLLRGFLYVSLNEARDLPDTDTAFWNIDSKDTSDPLAQVKIGTNVICKTAYINNNVNPKWNESYRIPICHEAEFLKVMVMDKDHVGAGKIGEYEIRVEDIIDGGELNGWYPLSGCDGKVNFKMSFVPKENIEATFEVPECYFKMQEGCKVRLYQDAHCPTLPLYANVLSSSGDSYDPPCAWTDLYKALNEAQKFIYMTGWSVYAATVLVRECCQLHSTGVGETVGELLKKKADEGVRVLILIWNEKLSTEVTPGLMGTHDEETRDYFQGSNVEVAIVPRMRILEGLTSYIRNQFSETCYTHHQKTIILDADPGEGEELRRVIAFVGGLDVTNGRWDTPEHELYKTLKNKHCGDFYNGCVTTTEEVGPRQPWHDIHCKVEGPIVMDILANFNERWRQQANDMLSRLKIITEDEFAVHAPAIIDEDKTWNVQLFRSITSDSASFDFDRISTIPKRKGKYVDDSIHRAYIHHIRKADKFIYIENQYFLGSAYCWDNETKTKAHHIIPAEICQKIIEKMDAGEHFCAYIVIPMYPEGDPVSKPVQEILHWQHKTMGMMYKKISAAIDRNGFDTHPSDYLAFYCLGKGEASDEIPDDLPPPDPDTPAVSLREQVRFMIYVHSKMMIVDDDYIIIGSANINQRSMGGTRDSEIAVGCFQSKHTRETSDGSPRGDVHCFRTALWAEHLGGAIDADVHSTPGTIDCMRAVNEAAQVNWEQFIANEPCHLDAHLLKYPLTVEQDGTVNSLQDCPNFPETEAPIIGAPNYLPNKLTT